jgi:integrase/recombinase XerD
LLSFIQTLQKRNLTKQTINNYLNTLSHYFDYLIQQGKRTDNPAKNLRLKNKKTNVFQNLHTPQQLEMIYHRYANRPAWEFKDKAMREANKRNTILLGLLIHQGIQTAELKKLEKQHINLHQATIYIPATARSNARTLKLHATQILPLEHYLNNLKESEQQTALQTLFNPKNVSNYITWLIIHLNQQNPEINLKNAQHIRQSVIVNWLKTHNIRQVQYMAGHKLISSTEHYKQQDLSNLQHQLNQFHPLG